MIRKNVIKRTIHPGIERKSNQLNCLCNEDSRRYSHHEYRLSLSKKSGWSWAFSDGYGRMDKGDERCWNVGKWIEIW